MVHLFLSQILFRYDTTISKSSIRRTTSDVSRTSILVLNWILWIEYESRGNFSCISTFYYRRWLHWPIQFWKVGNNFCFTIWSQSFLTSSKFQILFGTPFKCKSKWSGRTDASSHWQRCSFILHWRWGICWMFKRFKHFCAKSEL